MLDNRSSYDIYEFYASPSDVGDWEDDILGSDILASGQSVRVTIADARPSASMTSWSCSKMATK